MKHFPTMAAAVAAALLGCVRLAAAGPAPTVREIEEQILPLLLEGDICDIRRAGLDWGPQPKATEFDDGDEEERGQRVYTVSFTVPCTATEDLYSDVGVAANFPWWYGDDEEEAGKTEIGCVLAGRKGDRVPIEYECDVERRDGRWVFAEEPDGGDIQWPSRAYDPRARSFWEEWARRLGKRVEFQDSEDELEEAIKRRHGAE